MKKIILLTAILLANLSTYGQDTELLLRDNLTIKPYDYLISNIIQNEELDSIRSLFIDAYLKKAKINQDLENLIIGYYIKGTYSNYPEALKYFDSSITISANSKNIKYFPQIFLEYGNSYYDNGIFTKAFDCYVDAKKYSDSTGDTYITYASNINIAYVKEIIGDYEGALNIYKENDGYIDSLFVSEEFVESKLSNYHSLAYAYLKLNSNDSATYYNKKGYNLALNSTKSINTAIFSLVEGINHFSKKQLQIAKDSILIAEEGFKKNDDHMNLAFSKLYLGKIYLKENDIENSISKLNDAEKIIINSKRKNPDLAEIYSLLWNIYKSKKDIKNELIYLKKYINYENSLKDQYKDLYPSINKKYDIPLVTKEREKLIRQLNKTNKYKEFLIWIGLFLLIIFFGLGLNQYLKSRFYQKKFEEILITKSYEKQTNNNNDISNDVTDNLLLKLNYFEKTEGYLDHNLSLNSLADKLDTNSSYLSKVINSSKKMGFSKYISNLRIDAITEKLMTDEKLRKYTIKAIAFDAGFKNPESFSKYFKEKNGLYPSMFIKKLEKQNSLNS